MIAITVRLLVEGDDDFEPYDAAREIEQELIGHNFSDGTHVCVADAWVGDLTQNVRPPANEED